MRLLVLDDVKGICRLIAHVATEEGWSVYTATKVDEFWPLMRQHRADALVIDLHLGESDGIEVLRALHNDSFLGPIVLISGFDQRVLETARELGESLGLNMAAAMKKPIRVRAMRDVLGRLRRSGTPAAKPTPNNDSSPRYTAEDVAGALDRGEMMLHFQPIVESRSLAVAGIEALIRWRHPIRGLVRPDQFIKPAEERQETIDHLTMWVIQGALEHYQRLKELGLAVPIAVNISGNNLRRREFPDLVAWRVTNSGYSPDVIKFEITESVATGDPQRTMDILARLRLKGFDLAIDDLGTGFSSLSALRHIPFSQLKIDKTFVSEIQTSIDSRAIVKSVIDLAHHMELESVAEGVESEEIAQELIQLGVDQLQGYHYSRPLALTGLIEWLRKWRKRPRVPASAQASHNPI
jgi:EAL domain-containing protein (putative c-di-GMP-specific phosphodiesterase class I)